jgi:hypothetical protein
VNITTTLVGNPMEETPEGLWWADEMRREREARERAQPHTVAVAREMARDIERAFFLGTAG